MMMCVLCYSHTESPKDPLGSAHSPNHGWPQVFSWVVYCVCHLRSVKRLESFSYSLPGRLLSLSHLHPHVLRIASWLTAALGSIPLVQECLPQLLHSPKEEYLFASKFGQLWIKLLSTFMCSFLGGHTFSTDLGRGQEVCNGWIYKRMFPFASTCHVILQGARPHCASYCGTEALPLSHRSPTSPTFGTVCVLGHSNKVCATSCFNLQFTSDI